MKTSRKPSSSSKPSTNAAPKARPEPSPRLRVDLHAHSHFSDGEHSPQALARFAQEAGVVALALTDHDCLDGLAAFRGAAQGFLAIDGVEVSAREKERDVHILGLFIEVENALFRSRLATLAEARAHRLDAMVDRLQGAGVPITRDLVLEISPQGTLGRPHVAMALVRLGIAGSVDDAFRRVLRPHTPGFVPKPGPPPEVAIAWIHEAGGVAVLAHPGLSRVPVSVEAYARAGLDGLEVWHPKHRATDRKRFLALARRLDLVPTGGSDYHGASVGDSQVGQEPVPPETLDRLRERLPRS